MVLTPLDRFFIVFLVLLLILILSLIAENSLAVDNIHIGALKVMPSLAVTREYNDNFFPRDVKTVIDENGNEKQVKVKKTVSFINLKPALQFLFPFRQNSFNLQYHMDTRRFQNQDLKSKDTTSHYIDSKSELHLFPGLTTEISNNLGFIEYVGYHENDKLRNRENNRISLLTSYELGQRYKVEILFDKLFVKFKQKQFTPDNSIDTSITSSILYQVMPKTFFGFEYNSERYSRKDTPDQDTDYISHDYWVTMNFDDPDGRLNGTLGGGITKIIYDDPALNASGNNFFAFNGTLTFKKSKYTTIHFTGSRSQASTGITTEDAQYGSSYKTTTLVLQLMHKFTYKVSSTLSFLYGMSEYNTEGAVRTGGATVITSTSRKDTRKQWSGGLKYQMRDWLSFEVNYSHIDNSSNIFAESYKQNLFMTEISFKF
jgi:hypothetical protein